MIQRGCGAWSSCTAGVVLRRPAIIKKIGMLFSSASLQPNGRYLTRAMHQAETGSTYLHELQFGSMRLTHNQKHNQCSAAPGGAHVCFTHLSRLQHRPLRSLALQPHASRNVLPALVLFLGLAVPCAGHARRAGRRCTVRLHIPSQVRVADVVKRTCSRSCHDPSQVWVM